MFGNLSNKPAFGAAAPTTSFGFGQTAGAANPFGQNQNLFSKPSTGFGSTNTSTFGQPSTSLFSSTQPQQNLFQGNTSTFGAAPTTQSGFGSNLFGQPATGGLFNTSSTFGQQNKPTGFGFGTTQAQPSLFGAQQPQQTSSIFNPAGTTGLFGATTNFGAQQNGTVIKFNPVTGTDTMMKNGTSQNINTKHLSITCMKEYEGKSFEELRFEDYQANRKGPQQTTGFGTSTFGAPVSSAPPLFGQTDPNKPAFGQTTAFGQPSTPFGQTATTGFGLGAQQNTGGPFGAKPTAFGAPTSTTFGFGTGTTQNTNLFGATNATKPFGAPTAQPLFSTNTTPQTSSTFGTGIFSNTQNTNTGLFNKPAQPTPGFGAPGQTTGFNLTAPASTQPSLFSNTSKPLFGNTNTTPAFGTNNTFGLNTTGFSSSFKPAGTGFGTTQPTFTSALGGLANQNTSIFGNTNQSKPGGLFNTSGGSSLFTNTAAPFQTNMGFGLGQPQQQPFLLNPQEKPAINDLSLLTSDPFGDAPHLAGLEPKASSAHVSAISATDPKELKQLLDTSKKVDVTHNTKLKVTPLRSIRDSLFETIPKSSDATKSPIGEYQKTSCRRLILKPKQGPEGSPSVRSGNILDVLNTEDKENETTSSKKPSNLIENRINPLRLNFSGSVMSNSIDAQTFTVVNGSTKETEVSVQEAPSAVSEEEEPVVTDAGDSGPKKHPCGIVCSRPEYYTLPALEDLVPDENGSCIVSGFTIGRKGYGNVYFPDDVDVSGLNLDELVHFRYREINVYPDESKKPPIGQGLNRRAQVTLDNVYPRKSGTNTLINNLDELYQINFAEKLRKVTEKKGARFVDYRPETGSWVFKVDHFSKYGYNDSDDDTDTNGVEATKKTQSTVATPAESASREQAPERISKESLESRIGKEMVQKETSRQGFVPSAGFGLDKEIFMDDEEQDDMLHQSMLIDDMTGDYHHIPTEVPTDFHFGSYMDNRSIQVMKSTLFADDDRLSDGTGSHVSIVKQYLDLPDVEDTPRLPILREEVAVRRRPALRPKVWTVLNVRDAPQCVNPILPSRCYMDMALFKGKSFKVGWCKGFNFTVFDDEQRESNREIAFKAANRSPTFDPLKDILIDALKLVLEESTHSSSQSQIPTFRIIKTHSYLKKQVSLFEKLTTCYNSRVADYLHNIWTLCAALWGPADNSLSNRRHLLTRWLKTATNGAGFVFKDSRTCAEEVAQTIFAHLSTFKVLEAADMALNNRLPNLAMLIAQLSLPGPTKAFLQEQVEIWYNSMASNHISPEMKRLYLTLAGIPVKDDVNIFEGVDWKRAFGMHLWYICPNAAGIETAIDLYKNAFEEYSYAQKPNPPYVKDGYYEDGPYDVMYHILMLYKSRIHRLSNVLNPATYTDDPLDYRMSWLLLQLFLSLDVGLIESFEVDKLCTSFSLQLEQLGHWEWAIFVLLFLKSDSTKENLVMGILDRNLGVDNDQEIIDTLVNEMHVPPEWIHSSKGYKSLHIGKPFEAFNHFALAENYVAANDILVEHLLPNLFINEQFDLIRILVDKLTPGADKILRWRNEAGLFLEFLDLQEETLGLGSEILTKLQMKLGSISERITSFPMKNDQQRLCVAEFSKRCASLYKELCKKSPVGSFKESYNRFVDSLIMPPDFKQNEGLYLINEFYSMNLGKHVYSI